jgi:hypothetical protein
MQLCEEFLAPPLHILTLMPVPVNTLLVVLAVVSEPPKPSLTVPDRNSLLFECE